MIRRNCCRVILEMLNRIPPEKVEFIEDLKWNFEDASYKPPEETLQWERTAMTLKKHIPKPEKDWEWEVLSIFTTRSIEDLKKVSKNDSKIS